MRTSPGASSSTGGVPQKAPLDESKCSQAGSASPEFSVALSTSEAPWETPRLGSTMPGKTLGEWGGKSGGEHYVYLMYVL